MPHLISNLVEKAYTPYTARLAPRNLWSYPTLRKSNSKFAYEICSTPQFISFVSMFSNLNSSFFVYF